MSYKFQLIKGINLNDLQVDGLHNPCLTPKNYMKELCKVDPPTSYKWSYGSYGAPINGLINWVTGVLKGAPFHSMKILDPVPSVWRSLPRHFLRSPNCHSFRTVLQWRALDSHVTGRWFFRSDVKKKWSAYLFWMENMKTGTSNNCYLVGGFNPFEKYESLSHYSKWLHLPQF